MCCGDFCFIVFFVILTKVRILCEHRSLFDQRGCQIGCAGFGFASLTSQLALRASPLVKLIWLPKIQKTPLGGVSGVPDCQNVHFVSRFALRACLSFAQVKAKIRHVRSALDGFCRTDFVSSLATLQIHKEPPLRGDSLCIGVARLAALASVSLRSLPSMTFGLHLR